MTSNQNQRLFQFCQLLLKILRILKQERTYQVNKWERTPEINESQGPLPSQKYVHRSLSKTDANSEKVPKPSEHSSSIPGLVNQWKHGEPFSADGPASPSSMSGSSLSSVPDAEEAEHQATTPAKGRP
jgi:hypothetical protein